LAISHKYISFDGRVLQGNISPPIKTSKARHESPPHRRRLEQNIAEVEEEAAIERKEAIKRAAICPP